MLGVDGRIATSVRNRLCFFFSSRRRHTRFDCDWSSDVCSSDLASITSTGESISGVAKKPVKDSSGTSSTKFQTQRPSFATDDLEAMLQQHDVVKIGRASCRERV